MLIFVFALAAALLAWAIVAYNRLVRLRNQVKAGWSDIDVQLMRRHDLVPRLVEAVRAYAGHERELLERVTALRAEAVATTSPAQLAVVEERLAEAAGRVMLLHEAYPDLKADALFLQLQRDLVDVEDHLQYARRFYNGAVRALNDGVQRVPDGVVARLAGFGEAEYFHAPAGADVAPAVEMSP